MKKMKEVKFHLATGLLILTYYLIFNVTSDLDFMVALSDNMYYVFQVLLVLILGTIATIAFVKSEHWKECGRFQFRWFYLGVFLLSFFLLFVWANLTTYIFPRTQNGSTVVEVATNLTGISYFVTRILYTSIIAPVSEEVVCRGLLMTSLSKVKRYYLDVLVSAAIFWRYACFAVWLDNDRFHKVFWNGLDILYDVSLHPIHLLGYSSACFME